MFIKSLFYYATHSKHALEVLAYRHPRLFPDKLFLKIMYRLITGEVLNLNNPQSFNEKLQWLKLYDRKPKYTNMVDKYEVKNHVASIIGEKYIIPTIGLYNKAEEINFDYLPDQFVLKCTHDSGGVVICRDKAMLNKQDAIQKLRAGLNKNYYYQNREWPYKNVKPRIIAEKYMVDESGVELKDYKIFCFGGIPRAIQVDYGRFVEHKRNLYDTKWNRLPFTLKFPTDWNREFDKPQNLDEMLNIASKLSQGIPHLRVDLYNINGYIYFGELTFFHGSGYEKFTPEVWNYKFGNWINIHV